LELGVVEERKLRGIFFPIGKNVIVHLRFWKKRGKIVGRG